MVWPSVFCRDHLAIILVEWTYLNGVLVICLFIHISFQQRLLLTFLNLQLLLFTHFSYTSHCNLCYLLIWVRTKSWQHHVGYNHAMNGISKNLALGLSLSGFTPVLVFNSKTSLVFIFAREFQLTHFRVVYVFRELAKLKDLQCFILSILIFSFSCV